MDVKKGKEPQATVMMHRVVPLEEVDAERPGVLDRAEPLGESRRVLEGFELGSPCFYYLMSYLNADRGARDV
jgi:hypothetical protein